MLVSKFKSLISKCRYIVKNKLDAKVYLKVEFAGLEFVRFRAENFNSRSKLKYLSNNDFSRTSKPLS